MTRKRRTRAALGVLLVAATAAGLAFGYVSYVESRIAAAWTSAARDNGLALEFESARVVAPGRVEVRDLVVSDVERGLRATVGLVELRFSPELVPEPREFVVNVPSQWMTLRLGELDWGSQIHGRAEVRVSENEDASLREAEFSVANGRLSSRTKAAPGLSGSVELMAGAGHDAERVRGRLSIAGPTAATLLAVVGSGAVVHWLFPEALAGPFHLGSELQWSPGRLRLERVDGESGRVSVRGRLAWDGNDPHGALLVSTGGRTVGLRIVGGELKPELAPGVDWLERQLESAPEPVPADVRASAG